MKAVILSGGYGTRISEESHLRPKPMIEIGEMPILWHIMKEYSYYGVNEFIICAGYKQQIIKEWFANYFLHTSDVTFDLSNGNQMVVHRSISEPWKVTIVDTGLDTMTGGRVKKIEKYVENEPFFLTYGDGVSDVNIKKLYDFHKNHGKCVTITTVGISQQKGVLEVDKNNSITAFREKDDIDGSVINGGYMVCNPGVFDYLENDATILEREPMQKLAADGQLKAFYHSGFWQCMDTKREKDMLEELWNSGKAPWKVWEN